MNKDNDNSITRFIYMGDPQCSRLVKCKGNDANGQMSTSESGYAQWGRLLRSALEHKVSYPMLHESEELAENCCAPGGNTPSDRLLVLGGDIVNRGDKEEEWQGFLAELTEASEERAKASAKPMQTNTKPPNECYATLTVATPVNGAKASIGRHSKYFLNPANGPAGYEKNFYSFDYGCCHFIVLDSDFMGNRNAEAYKYIGYWIKADLAVNDKPVTIAVMHHPMFLTSDILDDKVRAEAMRENYLKLLHKYGVDFILCGHQHAYCRTPEISCDETGGSLTQIMGVSGTKFFEADSKDKMECSLEETAVATVFETDGKRIVMETVDSTGSVRDRFEKEARKSKPRHCDICENFERCGGTGAFEKAEAEANAKILGDPLKPKNKTGIVITCEKTHELDTVYISDEKIKKLDRREITYSVRLRRGIAYESKVGVLLEDLLEAAGWEGITDGDYESLKRYILTVTGGNGMQRSMDLSDVLWAGCYEAETGKGEGLIAEENSTDSKHKLKHLVPAMLFEDDGEGEGESGYRLAFGQKSPEQFNRRQWLRDIREILIRK